MLGDPYAVVADLEARLGKTDDGTFVTLLTAASRAIEAFTKTQFNTDNAATARRYRALDCERLPVDQFHTTTGLVVETNDTAWDTANVDPRPWDGLKSGVSWVYEDLFAVNRTWPLRPFRRATITVTANWGWAEVPAAIKESTLDVATVMSFGYGGGESGPVRSEAIDGYSVSYVVPTMGSTVAGVPPELRKALPYVRKRFGVA